MSMTQEKAVVLLSGGLDSAVTLATARSQGFAVFALSFSYGQRQRVELDAARILAQQWNVQEHRIIDIDLRSFGGSALTSDIAVPKGRFQQELVKDIPVTYVPARNTLFLSYALAWAEVIEAFDLFIGINAVDYSGYPDCRPEFARAFETMANLGTALDYRHGKRLRLNTPLINLSKADIIRRGVELKVDLGQTHSCYDPVGKSACGLCDACILRQQGFVAAGVPDPTHYTSPTERTA
ncbi:MAG: 7-cyano-7-deazaguanine synthase QueC [Myxococcota bacterium]